MVKHHSFNHFNVVLVSFSFVFCYSQIMKSSTTVLLFSIFVLCVAGKKFYLCIAVSNTASSQKKVNKCLCLDKFDLLSQESRKVISSTEDTIRRMTATHSFDLHY